MPGSTPNLHLPYPVPGDLVDVPRDVKALADAIDASGLLPPGVIQMWPGDAAPNGWAILNGATVPSAANPKLAAIFGESGGNVTLPDMRDRNPAGATALILPRTTGGVDSSAVLLDAQQLPGHNHSFTAQVPMASGATPWNIAFDAVSGSGTRVAVPGSAVTPTNQTDSLIRPGGQTTINARDKFYALNFIIKLG